MLEGSVNDQGASDGMTQLQQLTNSLETDVPME